MKIDAAQSGDAADIVDDGYSVSAEWLFEEIELRKIGLIGGIGPESTFLYYGKLIYAAHDRGGKEFFSSAVIESLNVF